MKRFPLASLRNRLILLVLIGVIPALGFILYTGWSQRQVATSLMKDNAIRVVRLAALEQDQLINGTRHLLTALAQLPEIRNRNLAETNAILKQIQDENMPVYASLGLIDPGGDVIACSLPLKGKVNLGDRQYFQRAMSTRGFAVGSFQVGRITGKPSINFGYPVHDSRGQLNGVIFAAVELTWLNAMIAKAQFPPGTRVYVMERGGTVLARYPADERMLGKPLPIRAVADAVAARIEGTLHTRGVDGEDFLFAFTRLGDKEYLANLYVALGIPERIAYAEVNRSLTRNLAGLALAATLAMLAAWIGGDAFILKRIRALVRATRRLAAGDLEVRTEQDYGMGELGELARAFDDMAAALQTREAQRARAERELRALNEVLEERVEERTRELQERTHQIEADLEMARDLQQAFLPHQPPGTLRLETNSGCRLQFFHRYHPTGKVGGDFFDVLALPDYRAGVFICDVMGQGIRAALVTAIVRGLVEELKPIADRAGEFMTQINRGLAAVFRETDTPMFATAFYMIADPETGQVDYANAGHPSPLHVRQNDCEVVPLQTTGPARSPALGLIDGFDYPAYQANLQNGDLIVMYTDGLFEVDGPHEEEFGQDRLQESIQKRIMLPPLLLFDELLTEVQQFSSTHEFSDDVCLVGMQIARRGSPAGAYTHKG